MDYVTVKTERQLEKEISELVRKADLKFHMRNKRNNQEICHVPGRSDFIRGLLNRSIKDRIGCSPNALQKQLMPHPYFKGIDWSLVEQKKLNPPYKPPVLFKIILGW